MMRVVRVFVVASLFVGMLFVQIPQASATHSGPALINPVDMIEDLLSRRSETKNQVLQVARSYYLHRCILVQGGSCVQYQDDFSWRVSGGWVQRRYDDWWNWSDSALISATLTQRHQNVQTAFPQNGPRIIGGIVWYYYCPLDGSADGSNRVGFGTGDGTPGIFVGVDAVYDIPTKMTNHVFRPSGVFVSNSVYSTVPFTLGDSTQWRWAPVCNAARHLLGLPGWEVQIEIQSYSADYAWDWGCWCNRFFYFPEYSDYRMQF